MEKMETKRYEFKTITNLSKNEMEALPRDERQSLMNPEDVHYMKSFRKEELDRIQQLKSQTEEELLEFRKKAIRPAEDVELIYDSVPNQKIEVKKAPNISIKPKRKRDQIHSSSKDEKLEVKKKDLDSFQSESVGCQAVESKVKVSSSVSYLEAYGDSSDEC